METFWFIAIVVMLAVYVVLDGFDVGTGIVLLGVARTDAERRQALKAIGPIWNGNEVWLIAGGALIFFAFPRAYAAGFSGFYLALIGVLWLLMFRGLAIELRSHFRSPLWRAFWDGALAVASLLLAVVLGAALGNLIRGVPLTKDGYFFTALWTTFTPGPEPGILDWYTVLMGSTGAAVLAVHGANYLAVKTEGDLHRRASRVAERGFWVMILLAGLAVLAIPFVQPALQDGLAARPLGSVLPALAAGSLGGLWYFRKRGRDLAAFGASALFILAMLGSAAWGLYPNLLIATRDPSDSLTIYNAAASEYGLRIGLVWFTIGMSLVIAYTIAAHRSFRGKVEVVDDEGYGG